MIAALFVRPGGPYYGLDDVDPWDEARDARLYPGPHPVVAHPPCTRWCMLAGLVEARWGYRRGEDDGCFEAALAAVRRWGGVLEHPAHSRAWYAYGLPRPDRRGGWQGGLCGGWSCYVEQGRYGHAARKATWLYVHGIERAELPALRWGWSTECAVSYRHSLRSRDRRIVSWCRNHGLEHDPRPRMGKREASETPAAFRDVLLDLARAARVQDGLPVM